MKEGLLSGNKMNLCLSKSVNVWTSYGSSKMGVLISVGGLPGQCTDRIDVAVNYPAMPIQRIGTARGVILPRQKVHAGYATSTIDA